MHPLLKTYIERINDGLLGSTLDQCSRWAENRIIMPPHNGHPKRPLSFEDFPWVREILNSRAQWNWVRKGAQVGLTVAGMVRGFHEVDYFGKDTLYLLPTDKAATLFSKTRLKKLVTMSPYLSRRVEDSIEVKMIGTSCLYIRGANGDINIKSTPADRLILDEVDEMDERQLWLAFERLSGQKDKVIWGMSTPTLPNHGIDKLFQKSTQEHFFFDCPHCKEEIELLWENSFVLCGESVDDPRCRESYLKCPICECKLDHWTKPKWLADGRWKPTALDADPDTRGFWLSQLYSTSVSPGELAIAYFRGMGDEEAKKEFYNSKLGLPYVEDGAQVTDAHIDRCITKYTFGSSLPTVGTRDIITLGIDQGSLHHAVAVKWELDKNALFGDVNDKAKGKIIGVERILQDDWNSFADLMRRYQVRACVVDFFPDPTNARAFARKFRGFVWLCQYVVGRGAREVTETEDNYGANIVKVDKASWLSKSLGRVMSSQIELPIDISYTFRQQLKNQIRVHKRGIDGNFQADWVKLADDHFGHALNYAEIALRMLDPSTLTNENMDSIR